MSKELRFKPHYKPTYFNKSLKIGVLSGLCALPLAAPWGNRGLGFALASGTILGGVASVFEKNRMDFEQVFGKRVKEPTFWNRDLLLGAMEGGIGGSYLTFGSPGMQRAVILGSAVFGGLAGASLGQKQMESEYVEALDKHRLLQKLNTSNDKSPSNDRFQIQDEPKPKKNFADRIRENIANGNFNLSR